MTMINCDHAIADLELINEEIDEGIEEAIASYGQPFDDFRRKKLNHLRAAAYYFQQAAIEIANGEPFDSPEIELLLAKGTLEGLGTQLTSLPAKN
ncbi:hypothetical protein [Paenochrobactrum glaciei]